MTHRTRTAHPRRFGSPVHLGGRFLGALWPGGPAGDDERWALGQLLPGECELWHRMSGPDRRHAVRVARTSAQLLERAGEAPRREIVAAALLHDVGKVASRLGTLARVVVTFASMALGEERVGGTRPRTGRRAGVRRYLEHDRIGGELLRGAGSDPFTVAWAEQHHLPPERWTIDRRLGELLKAADGG